MENKNNNNQLTIEIIKSIMSKYGKAWETLDPEAIIEIFNEDGTYQETPFVAPFLGHEEIKKYWNEVVKVKEKNIKFTIGNILTNGNVGIVEWGTHFTRVDNDNEEDIKGIILIEVKNEKIQKLWEYWHTYEFKD